MKIQNIKIYAIVTVIIISLLAMFKMMELSRTVEKLSKQNKLLRIERIVDNGYSPCNFDLRDLDVNHDGLVNQDDYELINKEL